MRRAVEGGKDIQR
eukprot:g34024.t1